MCDTDIPNPVQVQTFRAHVPIVAHVASCIGGLVDFELVAILHYQPAGVAARSVAPQLVGGLVDITAVVVQVVVRLVTGKDSAFFFEADVAGGSELLVRGQVQLIGKHCRAPLSQTHAAGGFQFPILMPLDVLGIEKQVGGFIAADLVRNQFRLQLQFQTGFFGAYAIGDVQDQQQDCRCDARTMHAAC